ncbi:MAG: flagellar protein FlgN [Lachnospiraceae bacterium]|nr:flagellar protein FlgN [Lachnospiraceae bacterium]
MASLMENLIEVLTKESGAYEGLLDISRRKTAVIVKGDLEALTQLTEEEQNAAGVIANLDKKRREITADIANVLNKDVNTLKLSNLVEILSSRPEEQQSLANAIEQLKKNADALQQVNHQNGELLKNSIEMVQFELNLLQSMKTAPETANYSRGGYGTGDTMGYSQRGFDAKQ